MQLVNSILLAHTTIYNAHVRPVPACITSLVPRLSFLNENENGMRAWERG